MLGVVALVTFGIGVWQLWDSSLVASAGGKRGGRKPRQDGDFRVHAVSVAAAA